MQATEIKKKKPKVLSQGTIFSTKNLSFKSGEKTFSLSDFYPELNIKGIDFGVVLTQDCDLYRDEKRAPKVTHISVALLEPFDSVFKELITHEDIKKFQHEYKNFKFINRDKILDKMTKNTENILNNNHPYLYFISLGRKSKNRIKDYFCINISKMVPIKVDHYNKILSKSKWQLKTEFSNKLGWQIAKYFGRVGTTDYTNSQLKTIAGDIFNIVQNSIWEKSSVMLSDSGFQEAKKIQPNMKEDRVHSILRDLNSNPSFKPQ